MSIFQQKWWLDAAVPGRWSEAVIVEKGSPIAKWPFIVGRNLGLTVSGMPPMTSTLGPWIAPLEGSVAAQRKREALLIAALFQRMPSFVFFKQLTQPTQENIVPFQILGFRVGLEQTFSIEPATVEGLWNGFNATLRNSIRHSCKTERFTTDVTAEEFLAIHRLNIEALQTNDRLDAAVFRRIVTASAQRGLGQIIGLRNQQGLATAALLIVQSHDRVHHLLQTRHPSAASSGAIEALTWNAIQIAHQKGLAYDLDGIPNAAAASRLLRYGGRLQNRFILTQGWPLALGLRDIQRAVFHRFGKARHFF